MSKPLNQYLSATAADCYKTSNVCDVGVEYHDNSGTRAKNFVSVTKAVVVGYSTRPPEGAAAEMPQ